MKTIQSIRREYGSNPLLENNIASDPFIQFETWFKEILEAEVFDPTAMVLATIDENNSPDTRVVLLKNFDEHGFVFFTNYNSKKAMQIEKRNTVALNFYWREVVRQVRIKGTIERISYEASAAYFSSRPRESQISALASKQSAVLSSRDELENAVKDMSKQYHGKDISCPNNWGGYCVIPFDFEFFQGRDNRLHDRIHYFKSNDRWNIERLSP